MKRILRIFKAYRALENKVDELNRELVYKESAITRGAQTIIDLKRQLRVSDEHQLVIHTRATEMVERLNGFLPEKNE